VGAFDVAPFIPVTEEQSLSDVRFDFALFGGFISSLVAIVVVAVRINF